MAPSKVSRDRFGSAGKSGGRKYCGWDIIYERRIRKSVK